MKIYLVRHGETEWNVLRRVQGSMDAPLTENGIQQAKNVAKRLAKVDFAAAFASPQMRAYRTAEKIVAEHPTITLQKEPSLREFSFGDWEGHKLDEMHLEETDKWDCYQKTPSLFTAPHGDCMIARVAESKAVVDRLLENHWGQNVLCVTHGYAIRIFMAAALGIPLESTRFFMAGNTAVSIIEYKRPDMPQMRVFGDVSHNLT